MGGREEWGGRPEWEREREREKEGGCGKVKVYSSGCLFLCCGRSGGCVSFGGGGRVYVYGLFCCFLLWCIDTKKKNILNNFLSPI